MEKPEKPGMPHPEETAGDLIARLERYWSRHYSREELQHRLVQILQGTRRVLASNSDDARLVIASLRHPRQYRADPEQQKRANDALKRILKGLGVATVGVLPLAFITLPGLFALARHYNIELLPGDSNDE